MTRPINIIKVLGLTGNYYSKEDKEFSSFLSKKREQLGWSKERLAVILGMTTYSIGKIENCKSFIFATQEDKDEVVRRLDLATRIFIYKLDSKLVPNENH